MKILINLIGGQTIPNLIAYKYVNPDLVILLYSEDSARQKDYFIQTCNSSQAEEIQIPPYDYYEIKSILRNILKKYSKDELILNFTSGTKIMSIASFELFRENSFESIYIDSQNNKIYKYKGIDVKSIELNIPLTLEEYLKINGHTFKLSEEKEVDETKKEYFEYLEVNYNKNIAEFLAKINSSYETDKNKFYKEEYCLEEGNYKYFWNNEKKSSTIVLNDQKFEIFGKDSIKYITGLWFEDLVYYKKFYDSNLYDEILRNIHIQNSKTKQDMIELDIIGLYKNNFHLFELKSGKPKREALNNLKTVKEQLGRYTKVFLISYFDLDENDPLKDRMQDLGIEFFKYSDFSLNKCIKNINVNL